MTPPSGEAGRHPLLGPGAGRRIRALRPARPAVSPDRPLGWSWEEERAADGRLRPVLTAFLAGAECPLACLHCDMWRHTLAGATPPGALPAQLAAVLEAAGPIPPDAAVKLYNASNFFVERAVPAADEPALAELLAPFAEVVVECHPSFLEPRVVPFAQRLAARLQVAMGLETVHPRALAALDKRLTVAGFTAAAVRLRAAGIGVRAFVLVGAPGTPAAEAAAWAVRSAAVAAGTGAEHVSLIPLRPGNGAVDRLVADGAVTLPTLADLETALDAALALPAVVTADLWDLDRLGCPACRGPRRERLARLNRTGRAEPRVPCPQGCGG